MLIIQLVVVGTSFAQLKPFAEAFVDNKNQWPFIEKGNGYSISIDGGHLIMDANTTAIHTFKNLNLDEDYDFALEARMIFINGSRLGWMGFRFGMNEDANKFISFVYNNDKGFMIGTNNGKKYQTIRESKSHTVKPYDYNTLTVIKTGTTYRFLINEKQVHEAKIKAFYGPMVSLVTNTNMKMQVDDVQLYDPKKGKQKLQSDKELPALDTDLSLENLEEILNDEKLPDDYKTFLDNFVQLPSPFIFHPETGQGVDVSHLTFTQKTFYKYVASNVRNKSIWAIGKLGECKNGEAVLVLNRYLINNQDVSRFIVVAFDKKGNLVGEKEVGAIVKEGDSLFQLLDFKAYRDGDVINVEGTVTYHNGNKERNNVRFNTALCNL